MNVILRGETKNILENMVNLGYANTQSEAIRLAILWFGKEQLSEVDAVNKKLDYIDQEIENGNRKLLNREEALGSYAKHLK